MTADGWVAVATFALALVTVGVTAWSNHRDDRKRAQDRADRLAAENETELAKADQDAWRVVVFDLRVDELAGKVLRLRLPIPEPPQPQRGEPIIRATVVRAPLGYPLGVPMVTGACWNSSVWEAGTPWASAYGPYMDDSAEFLYWVFWATHDAHRYQPVLRFTDSKGRLYYQFRGVTKRFSQNVQPDAASREINGLIMRGPSA